jgi:hypothetical protein
VNSLRAYQGLKRLTGAATILLFTASLVIGYLYLDKSNDLWTVALWSGVFAPVAVTMLILTFIATGQRTMGFGGPGRIRVLTALWIVGGIEIPWILAWLGANTMGNVWQHLYEASQPAPYLWAVRLLTWFVAFALASALAVFAMIMADIRISEGRGENSK